MTLQRTDAGEPDVSLVKAYARCREINRAHGRSYFLATRLLPAHKRPHVHALYGFTRSADDIVDSRPDDTPAERERRLTEWGDAFLSGLRGGPVVEPILPAVLHTIRTYGLDLADFDHFLASMAMDLTVTEYATYDDLLGYMEGSAAVIGTMMLPILGVAPGGDLAVARESARQLGFAFQLTNFLRDVHEDLARGRIYLPQTDLAKFGVTIEQLRADATARRASRPVRDLIEFEAEQARDHYRAALPGLEMLEPRSRVCIRAALLLYGGILDQIARNGFDVLRERATVPGARRAAIVAAAPSYRQFSRLIRRWRIV